MLDVRRYSETLKVGVLKNFANFTGTAALEFLFNKAEGPQLCNFIKKDSNTGVFL